MACCALAAFILSQLYLGAMGLHRFLGKGWLLFTSGRFAIALALSIGAGGVAYAVGDGPSIGASVDPSTLFGQICSVVHR